MKYCPLAVKEEADSVLCHDDSFQSSSFQLFSPGGKSISVCLKEFYAPKPTYMFILEKITHIEQKG